MRRRSHLAYLLALLVLVPLTAGLQYAFDEHATRPPMHEVVSVARTVSVDYAGARWKLAAVRTGPPQDGVRLPRGAVVVYAAFSVQPHDRAASRRIGSCRFEAVDGAGRTWGTAATGVPDLAALGDPPTGCYATAGDFEQKPIPPGTDQRVLTAFVVPKRAVTSLRIQVQVEEAAPAFLEFRPK